MPVTVADSAVWGGVLGRSDTGFISLPKHGNLFAPFSCIGRVLAAGWLFVQGIKESYQMSEQIKKSLTRAEAKVFQVLYSHANGTGNYSKTQLKLKRKTSKIVTHTTKCAGSRQCTSGNPT